MDDGSLHVTHSTAGQFRSVDAVIVKRRAPSYHVLVSVGPVFLLGLVLALEPLVRDCVPVYGCVVHHARSLPCHDDGRVVLGIGLNIFRL